MPTRRISLTHAQDRFVAKVVNAGEYQNVSEAMRDAVRALQQRRKEDARKLKALRAQIEAGVKALQRGDFTEVEDRDLERYLNGLSAHRRRR
jgi:antitoxin ParD1/3/4